MDLEKLPVIEIIKESFFLVWQKRFELFRALITTWLVLVLVEVSVSNLMPQDQPKHVDLVDLTPFLLLGIIQSIVFTLFAITCHRIILLGETSVPKYGLYLWTSRETKFLGWLILMIYYYFFLMLSFPSVLEMISPDFTNSAHVEYLIFSGFLAFLSLGFLFIVPPIYFFARLGILLPAIAIEEYYDTNWAFKKTKKNVWRIITVIFFTPIILRFLIDFIIIKENVFTDFFTRFIQFPLVVFSITSLSLCFRFLSSVNNK